MPLVAELETQRGDMAQREQQRRQPLITSMTGVWCASAVTRSTTRAGIVCPPLGRRLSLGGHVELAEAEMRQREAGTF